MKSWKDFYGGSYLSAKALGKKTIKAKIISVEPEEIKGNDGVTNERLCLSIDSDDRRVPLNATNASSLGEAFGENYERWRGKRILLCAKPTKYKGKATMGLSVTPLK